jgi:hypothetical protein
MAEVATAEGEGYTREKAKGNVPSLAGGAIWRCDMDMGVLDASETAPLQRTLAHMMD